MLRSAIAALLAALRPARASRRTRDARTVATLRVMLSPTVAPRGTLPQAARTRLEAHRTGRR